MVKSLKMPASPVRPQSSRSLLFMYPILALSILAVGGLYMRNAHKTFLKQNLVVSSPKDSIEFKMQWAQSKDLLDKDGTGMDICNIMPQCFGESKSHKTAGSCRKSMKDVLAYYDNGILIEKGKNGAEDKVVGFCSVYPYKGRDLTLMMIYNVCIGEGYRANGWGKRLVMKTVDAVMEKHQQPAERVLLALDVDLRSPTAADAFAAYAKMGFMRWVGPCQGIHNYDFGAGIREPLITPPLENNFVSLFRDPKSYISSVYGRMKPKEGQDPKSFKYPTHFCMYRWYNDSFHTIGAQLKAQIGKMDLKYGQSKATEDETSVQE